MLKILNKYIHIVMHIALNFNYIKKNFLQHIK